MSTVTTDPISDMLTRIRNAIAVRKHEITLPHSNIKEAVAKLLVANNFLENVTVSDGIVGKLMTITINAPDQNSRITEISRLSRPGRREYCSADEIPTVKRGRGLVILSTSKGLMTGFEAQKQHIGGELICKVY